MSRKFASLRTAEQEMLRHRYPNHVFEPDEDVTENGRPYAHLFAGVTDPPADPQHTQTSAPMLPLFMSEAAA